MGNMIHIATTDIRDPNVAVTAAQLEVIQARGCPRCGARTPPEPTDEERARLLNEPDFMWEPPDGIYLQAGFGLMGGGYGPYLWCEGCEFFAKVDLGPEAE